MAALGVFIVAVLIALGTVLLGWWAVPVVGAIAGVVMRGTPRPGATVALAGALAWSGYLGIASLGGAPVGVFGAALAMSMNLPAWAPITATIVYPALLAGLASSLGARFGGRYLSPS